MFTLLFYIVALTHSISSTQISMDYPKDTKPIPLLKKGDTISIIAPAGALRKDHDIKFCIELAKSWGLIPIIGKNIYNVHGHFAGTDKERLDDLQQALDNPAIKAIWMAKGGYGMIRIVDQINFDKFKKNPKWVIGYSDITVLNAKLQSLGFESIHGLLGLNLTNESENQDLAKMTLYQALFTGNLSYSINSNPYNKLGSAQGTLVGGNLTILVNLLGSNIQNNQDDIILFIEEIGEYKYSIDRLLYALDRAGVFKKCKGVVVGQFSKVKKNIPNFGQSIEEIILNQTNKYNIPVCFDFPAGHSEDTRALILGRKVRLDVKKEETTLNFL